MTSPIIFLVGADKGGVGKTTVTRALAEYITAGFQTPRLIDTQFPTGDLRTFHKDAELVDLDSTAGQMEAFDNLPAVTIIDAAAGLLSKTIATLDRTGVLSEVKEGHIRLVLLYLLGPSVSSLSEVVSAYRTLQERVDLYFVKNHISQKDFFGWEKDPRFASALEAMTIRTIDVPHMDSMAAEKVQQLGDQFINFSINPSNSRMLRGYVADWFKQVSASFNAAGLRKVLEAK